MDIEFSYAEANRLNSIRDRIAGLTNKLLTTENLILQTNESNKENTILRDNLVRKKFSIEMLLNNNINNEQMITGVKYLSEFLPEITDCDNLQYIQHNAEKIKNCVKMMKTDIRKISMQIRKHECKILRAKNIKHRIELLQSQLLLYQCELQI